MPVHQTALELLSVLRRLGSSSALREIPETFFLDEDERRAFTWFREYVRQYQAFPSPEIFRRETGIQTVTTLQPLNYYADRARERAIYYGLMEPFGELKDALSARHVGNALAAVNKMAAIERSLNVTGNSRTVGISEAVQMVLADFDEARQTSGLRGITTGWDYLDAATGGWQNGDLISVIGRPARGKTFVLLYMAYRAWVAGHSILFISMELAALQLARRMVGMHTGVNPNFIRLGRIQNAFQRQFRERTMAMNNGIPFEIVAGGFRKSTTTIRALIDDLTPDLIVADASYLIAPEKKRFGSGSRREVVSDTVEELKQIALDANRPIVQSIQFNRQAERPARQREGNANQPRNPLAHLSLARIGETDVVGQASSIVIGVELGEPPYEKTQRIMGFLKGREGEDAATSHWVINYLFSPVNMDIIHTARENVQVPAADFVIGCQMTIDIEREFDCCECGAHIWNAMGVPDPPLCAMCLCMPGWYTDPVIRKIFDPNNECPVNANKS